MLSLGFAFKLSVIRECCKFHLIARKRRGKFTKWKYFTSGNWVEGYFLLFQLLNVVLFISLSGPKLCLKFHCCIISREFVKSENIQYLLEKQ